jgi:hypothetical protein
LSAPDGTLPRVVLRDPWDELERVLEAAQLAVLRHPVAAQAIFAALVAEGRRYAATAEGAARRERLARSGLLERVREAWEIGTFNMLEDSPSVLPSAYVDTVMLAAEGGSLIGLLARLAARGAGMGSDDRSAE